MKFSEIEETAKSLQIQIWNRRQSLWPTRTASVLDMLDPAVAAKVLGVAYAEYEELGQFGLGRDRFEIAGMIDRQAGRIAVSKKFSRPVMRFTGAHELGHWILHPGDVMHRDRPIKGVTLERSGRSTPEKEADYFSACFLVPRKLAILRFEAAFNTRAPVRLDDALAFHLCPSDPDSLLRAEAGSLDIALALSTVRSYGGKHFHSLADQFQVSPPTMAIRLKELRLIED